MISFDGKLISYDPQGNPLNYLGHALRWGKGRQLKSFDGNTYTYNFEGIRISKTVDGIRHDYVVDGANILKETWQDNVLVPIYNNDEEVVGIHYNCEPYYFYKNLQGDVIGIADADGTEVVTYTYDAWGVCTVLKDDSGVGLANINPYRYRSYYYDVEIGMYYLQSRYYDPIVGRFVNADDLCILSVSRTVLKSNVYAYCNNCPVKNSDPTGYLVANIISAIIGALISALTDIIAQALFYWFSNKFSLKKLAINWWGVTWSAIVGLVTGALMVSKLKKGGMILVSALIGLVDGLITAIVNKVACKTAIRNILINIGVAVVGALIGGAGVGSKYFKKSFLKSGGLYFYGDYSASAALLLRKPEVLKDFAEAVVKYCYGNLVALVGKVVSSI